MLEPGVRPRLDRTLGGGILVERTLTIQNDPGLHARPASLFVREASRFRSSIFLSKDGLEVNGKSIMGLLMLAAGMGSEIQIRAEGPDETEAVETLSRLVTSGFGEDGKAA